MLEKVISYMKSESRPVSVHDIACAINESEVQVLGVMNVMIKKMMARLEYYSLSKMQKNTTYYVLSKICIEN